MCKEVLEKGEACNNNKKKTTINFHPTKLSHAEEVGIHVAAFPRYTSSPEQFGVCLIITVKLQGNRPFQFA